MNKKLKIKSRKLSAGNIEGITNETGHGTGLLFQKKLGSVSESFSEPEEFAVLQAGWIRNKWVRLKEISHGTVIDLNIQPVPGNGYVFVTEEDLIPLGGGNAVIGGSGKRAG